MTSVCMSGKETLITNKFGCLNKANISLSDKYILNNMSLSRPPAPYHTTPAGTVPYQKDDH